jgi:hypothetical protein
MTKVFKIIGHVLGILIDWVLIVLILFAFAIRTSPVQTYLAQKATAYLSKELGTTFKVDAVSIVFIDRVALDGVLVLDQQQDTLAYINTLYATLDELNLDKNFVRLDHAELDGGTVHINREKETGDYNFWFITDYFDSGKKKKKGGEPIDLYLNSIKLSDVNFKYDDFRKGYSTFGMDYDHISLKHVNLTATNFSSIGGAFEADIENLSADERCGFQLKKFSAHMNISPEGLKLTDLTIVSPLSEIKASKFCLLLDEMEDFQYFEDSVVFDAKLLNSKVSMKDVSYFASALEGMDQMVEVSGVVTNKVKNLKIKDLHLRTGKKTVIRGTINLPDFREFEKAFFSEKIDYAYISLNDLKKIRMPNSADDSYLSFDEYLERLGNFQATDLRLDGFYSQFVVSSDYFRTDLGNLRLDNGVMFTENKKHGSYFFERSKAGEYDVKVEKFQLGRFLNDSNFGTVDGIFSLSGEAFSLADIHFNLIEGELNRFDYMDYSYEDILISQGEFVDNIFNAKIEINDDNLNLVYDGFIDFNGNQHMSFSIDLTKAMLEQLGITQEDSTSLTSSFSVDIFGKSADNMAGSITMNGMLYKEGSREIRIPSLTVSVTRGKIEDRFNINSELADINLVGKINFSTLLTDFMDQFQKVFPSIVDAKSLKKKRGGTPSHFDYEITTHDLDDFLAIFAPDLKIKPHTTLSGHYDGRDSEFNMTLLSDEIDYQEMRFEGISLYQNLTAQEITADYKVNNFSYSDSIELQNVHFKTRGTQGLLNSELSWNPTTTNESLIIWETNIVDNKHLNFTLRPSYFSINEQRWEIENQSDLTITENEIHIAKFKVERKEQYISIDGCISRNDADKLNFNISDIDLTELGTLIGSSVKMEGKVNGWGYISNPYTNLTYIGDAAIQGLFINDEEVGDIFMQSQWNKASESVGLMGDLLYRGNQTFKFDGSYFLEKEKENIDFNLVFDETDLQFTNAFMDPDVVNNIHGLLNGSLKVTGSADKPIIEGDVNLVGGNAKIELLGVNFGFDGKISADEYGFYIDNMPVSDEEGNTGSLIGSVYHDNFADWNFDLQFDLENDAMLNKTPFASFMPFNTMDKFLVLNTQYKEGDYYYGKAYVTGTANIFGFADNIEITVDLQSKKGTFVNFPMYGAAELEEEEGFITFKQKGNIGASAPPAIDFTGVDLDLNFRVTPDAKLKIIFNEITGDEIMATGNGDIAIKLDNLGDLSMDGTFKVKEGLYNFTMGPIKQPFLIEEGGTIAWTGDPYNATLDIKTYCEVNADLRQISPNELQTSSQQNNQNNRSDRIVCYLGLTESLLKPTIGFDIKAPRADETGKALLARVTGDPDELNKQFFSLMVLKRFQPLKGLEGTGLSSVSELAQNQINTMLSQVSKDYKMNVNLDANEATGEKAYEFGLSKGFLDNRLILTGSFGVETATNDNKETSASGLMGDVSLEYLLNESGTFRINVFNESNDNTVIQEKTIQFTQGAGLHYQEDFDNFDNFRLAQSFLDIFRSKQNKKYPIKRKKRQTPVPTSSDGTRIFVLPYNNLRRG